MNVLVFGFFNKNNAGDNYFQDAFQVLFPAYNFTFVDHIKSSHLIGQDAVFLGGGSFLDGNPPIWSDALDTLLTGKIPLFYIGVGCDGDIHPTYQQLLKVAKLIAVRSFQSLLNLEKIGEISATTMFCPDLVFALRAPAIEYIKNRVLIIPNVELLPAHDKPHWQHVSWEYFKNEFAQMCDELVKDNIQINFLPFCTNQKLHDNWAAAEIVAKMSHQYRSDDMIMTDHPTDFNSVIQTMSQQSLIITQRYHGVVLSELAGRPYVAIAHHDKLKTAYPNRTEALSYYGINKALLLDAVKNNINKDRLSIVNNDKYFVLLKTSVSKILCQSQM